MYKYNINHKLYMYDQLELEETQYKAQYIKNRKTSEFKL